MKIDVETRDRAAVVRLHGELRGDDDGAFARRVGALLDAADARIVIDLAGVDYVSSAGLSDLVKLTARANSQGVSLVLCRPTPFVAGVFQTTRLDSFFQVFGDLEAALAHTRA